MEEKKCIKINFSSVLFLLELILIIAMAYYIYLEKTNLNNEITILKASVNEMQDSLKDLEEKIDKASTTINSSTSGEINNSQSNNIINNENNKFSDKEIQEAITNYLNIFVGPGSQEEKLVELGLLEYGEFHNNELTSDNYRKTDIKYSDFKSTVMNYMTEEWFNTINTRFGDGEFIEEDGILYYFDGGWTGIGFDVENITLKGDYSDSRYIAKVYQYESDVSKEVENIEFEVTNYNGKCVISYCD